VLLAGTGRVVVTGVSLPDPPPGRVYISGHQYRIVSPSVVLPAIANVVKLILNWVGPAGRVAKNILFAKMSGGTGSTSDPIFLNAVANGLMSSIQTATISPIVNSAWTLSGVTARDAGGTSAQGVSTHAPIVGGGSGQCLPPNVAVAISWIIPESYRGGKPRTYLPGVSASALIDTGQSGLTSTFCSSLDAAATLLMNDFNTHPISGSTVTLGTVSYHTGHAVRPTPLFRTYVDVKVHERVDSQRRRLGKESAFPVTP
jgi:hypothetical protein